MHSSEASGGVKTPIVAAAAATPVPSANTTITSGATLLKQLASLIIHGRQVDARVAKLRAATRPSTSSDEQAILTPEQSPRSSYIEQKLHSHVRSLWNEHIPLSIEVFLAPECSECSASISAARDELPHHLLLVERWTLSVYINKHHETPAFINSQWLLNAIRSQLHFSQISAWHSQRQRSVENAQAKLDPNERQRKLSREQCNIKKLEANCDETELIDYQKGYQEHQKEQPKRSLNVVYALRIPGETFKIRSFQKKPTTDHVFPITDIGNNTYLKVVLESLPRSEEVPHVKCPCAHKQRRRHSKDLGANEELAQKMSTLTLGSPSKATFKTLYTQKLCTGQCSPIKNEVQAEFALLDDRMQIPCSEAGKHRCSCDEESDIGKTATPSCSTTPKQSLDRRLKEIAKQRRRLRKETELLKMRESGTSDSVSDSNDNHPATSIPILQASRFDRFRTFGYRLHRKDPPKATASISTQTDDSCFDCGDRLTLECRQCFIGKTKRQDSDDEKATKKQKYCDNSISMITRGRVRNTIQSKIESVLNDRKKASDIADLSLDKDDSVFDFESTIPSTVEVEHFRLRLDSAASMVFHTKTGLPLTSSPAPIRKGKSCFDYDSTITGVSGIKSALCHPDVSPKNQVGSLSPPPKPRRGNRSNTLLGSFEESVLKGRLEPVATVDGFTAELGASGSFCPSHVRLPVTVFFYALGGTNAPYLGHINLGSEGYHVPRSGTIQVSLLNPHGTLVKMFVVLYDLSDMPAKANTFLRQRTMHTTPGDSRQTLAYLIHLRFMTSQDGKLYLHTDIRMIVSKKADLDTGAALTSLNSFVMSNDKSCIAGKNDGKLATTTEHTTQTSSPYTINDSGYHEEATPSRNGDHYPPMESAQDSKDPCALVNMCDTLKRRPVHVLIDRKSDARSHLSDVKRPTYDSSSIANGNKSHYCDISRDGNEKCARNVSIRRALDFKTISKTHDNFLNEYLLKQQNDNPSVREDDSQSCDGLVRSNVFKPIKSDERPMENVDVYNKLNAINNLKRDKNHANCSLEATSSFKNDNSVRLSVKNVCISDESCKSDGSSKSDTTDLECLARKKISRSQGCFSLANHCQPPKKLEHHMLPSYELRSYTIAPENPRFSLR